MDVDGVNSDGVGMCLIQQHISLIQQTSKTCRIGPHFNCVSCFVSIFGAEARCCDVSATHFKCVCDFLFFTFSANEA